MQNPLKSLGNLNKLRRQAQQMQQQLAAERIVVEENGVRIVMGGDQQIYEFTVDGAEALRIRNAVEHAIKKSQKIAAKKMLTVGSGWNSLLGQ